MEYLEKQLLALDGHTYRSLMARWMGTMRRRALSGPEEADYEGIDAELSKLTPEQFVALRERVSGQRKARHSSAEARRARYHALKERRELVSRARADAEESAADLYQQEQAE